MEQNQITKKQINKLKAAAFETFKSFFTPEE